MATIRYPNTPEFIRELVRRDLQHPLPPSQGITFWLFGRIQFWEKTPVPGSAWQTERDKVEAESDSIVRALYRRAEAALPGKDDAARTATLATIAKHSPERKL